MYRSNVISIRFFFLFYLLINLCVSIEMVNPRQSNYMIHRAKTKIKHKIIICRHSFYTQTQTHTNKIKWSSINAVYCYWLHYYKTCMNEWISNIILNWVVWPFTLRFKYYYVNFSNQQRQHQTKKYKIKWNKIW